ncbi:MAG TPA: HAMP domain-containing sensor histidine kinase [Mycobacteriales bacterium]|nr:HAMP domain-containing sensor histidine kinase [Mycobacteriales bacterium]
MSRWSGSWAGGPQGGWRLPAGHDLLPADYAWRHRVVRLLIAAHLPVLVIVAQLRDHGFGLLQILPVAALLLGATVLPGRRLQASAATLALLGCSAGLVHLFDQRTDLMFHSFVAVAVVALYQDWVVYALAVGFVGLQYGLLDLPGGWTWALVHAGFVLAEAAVLVVFWQANEAARAEQERMRQALVVGQTSVQARLAETDRIRTDLIGTVSHEFRTPLTGIRGAALTLLKRGERLDDAGRTRLLLAVLDQQERLSRLLENMLTAAQATATDPCAAAEVDAVAAEVAMLADAARPEGPPVSLLVEPGTTARIDRQALHQVLANLVDNAQQHGAAGAVPLVAGGSDERGVWLTISNEGTTLDSDTARRLFEPFTQLDSGPTRQREGLGMGLYVVRRLVEVYGGSVALRSEGGWTTVELRLDCVDLAEDDRRIAV